MCMWNECFVIERKYVPVGSVTYDKRQSNNESLRKERKVFYFSQNVHEEIKNFFILRYQVYEKCLTQCDKSEENAKKITSTFKNTFAALSAKFFR